MKMFGLLKWLGRGGAVRRTKLCCVCIGLAGFVSAADSTKLETQFRELPMEARRLTGPFLWMHGTESQAQLERELGNVLTGGNGSFTAEPRPHQDWLGEGWYRDLDICLQFAKKNDLSMIIYDDWWWPSQMMGGRVPPQYGSKIIEASAVSVAGSAKISQGNYGGTNLIAVVAGRENSDQTVDGASLIDLTASVKDGALNWDAPPGNWKIMKFSWAFKGGTKKKMISVDGASPDCVDWFLKTVYQPHYDRFKADFGKTIVGYFYDEPETQGDWGTDVPVLIAERKLDLNKLLVAYKFKLAGEEQTAAFYTYLDTFAESWGRTMYGGMTKWCRERGVFSMGHFMEHKNAMFDRNLSAGNMMQLQKYSSMGGIDLVCNQVHPGERKMDLYEMPRIASSISHTCNNDQDIAFSEVYGGYKQNLTYPEMKWLADWHQVRGVNFFVPHSFNPRAPYDKDFPPYFNNGGFEPRWPLYRVWADYTCRLSTMLTGGRHVCPIAFLQIGQSIHVGKAVRPEELTSTLEDALFDCDWLLYDTWENDAALKGKEVKLRKEEYQILIVPPVEVIPYATLAKAKAFFDQGGMVVGYDFLPSKSATTGKSSADIEALCAAIWGDATPGLSACKKNAAGGRSYFLPAKPTVEEVQKVFTGDAEIHPALEVVEGQTGNWLHILHRVKDDRDVFLVCNQNIKDGLRNFKFRVTAAGEPECWDPMRNEITAVPCKRLGKDQVEVDLALEPSESVMLVFQKEKRALPMRLTAATQPVREPITIVRDATPTELIIPSAPEAVPSEDTPAASPVASTPKAAKSKKDAPMLVTSPVTGDPFVGHCELPADVDPARVRVYIEMDDIVPEAAARVTINGQDAGGFIGKPFRLNVTKHLKPGENKIVIEPFAPKSVKLVFYP